MIPKFNLHDEIVLHYVMINRFVNKFFYRRLDTRYHELTIEFLYVAFKFGFSNWTNLRKFKKRPPKNGEKLRNKDHRKFGK